MTCQKDGVNLSKFSRLLFNEQHKRKKNITGEREKIVYIEREREREKKYCKVFLPSVTVRRVASVSLG